MKYPKNTSQSVLFGSVECERSVRRCTGIKFCEFFSSEILQRPHSKVDGVDWEMIQELRQIHSLPSGKRNAIR